MGINLDSSKQNGNAETQRRDRKEVELTGFDNWLGVGDEEKGEAITMKLCVITDSDGIIRIMSQMRTLCFEG